MMALQAANRRGELQCQLRKVDVFAVRLDMKSSLSLIGSRCAIAGFVKDRLVAHTWWNQFSMSAIFP